jgi:hypothetical protein
LTLIDENNANVSIAHWFIITLGSSDVGIAIT